MITREGGDLATRHGVFLTLCRYLRDLTPAQRRGLERLGPRDAWRWLHRVRRIERRLDSDEIRGEGVNLRWLRWLDRLHEAHVELAAAPRRRRA